MYRLKGSPEVLVFNELADGPKSRDELVAKLGDVANVGIPLVFTVVSTNAKYGQKEQTFYEAAFKNFQGGHWP